MRYVCPSCGAHFKYEGVCPACLCCMKAEEAQSHDSTLAQPDLSFEDMEFDRLMREPPQR